MFALVDAVAFYASAEKVFDPSIRNKPVVVLTNNDGCVCAVCPIARKLNIPKFEPYFKLKEYLAQHNVVVRSSNYELYADLSDRMMNVIARYCSNQHVYSIDESFLQFSCQVSDWHKLGREIRQAVWREVKLPVGVGFGITPTLAKGANHAAKKLYGYNGVAVISDTKQATPILTQMKLSDVWGIGSRLSKRLALFGLKNAYDLAQQNPSKMRKFHSIVLEKTVRELNGEICLNWDEVKQDKKEIFSTRSFGARITDKSSLHAALNTHAEIIGRKLRKQNSVVKKLTIFAHNSPHDAQFIKRSFLYEFVVPTSDTCVIASAVSSILDKLFIANVSFYKCGLGAIELHSGKFTQHSLFDKSLDKPEVMQVYDQINSKYGTGTTFIASSNMTEKWSMRRAFLSPQYTTRWAHLPEINC
ncbi:Y-family DNA polymerase [Catenovulum adriaticum]|uniref:Y-family DNA polymerase n=1 Tax=Catenovulum adriaticum TaxID=2984846 RepID=A0ABY7ALH9_9ALTE|nr:Y-family DNA polymerase [Catenovulum sp. TS8]WAJ69526.1 Y-family DNA polymerase [Catenovulum sp. TS8]